MTCPAPESLVPVALGGDDPIVSRHVMGCASCQREVARLRETVGALRAPIALEHLAETPECLDEIAMADFVEGRLSADGRAPIVAHLLTCARCRATVRATAGLADARLAAEEAPRRWRRWLLPLGITAAAAVLLLVWARTEETDLPRTPRGPVSRSTVGPVPVAPRASVDRADRFVWSSMPRVERYRLRLYDAEGSVLWAAETTDTVAVRPDSVVLAPRVTYFWKVEAQTEWQRWSASDLVEFRIGKGRP